MNLADHCSDVENCPQVAEDIQFCQKRNIKILMSVGGATGPYRHQKWEADKLAWSLWIKFLGGTDRILSRPFGDVILDGIDFDPEATSGEGYDKLIHDLRTLFKLYTPPQKKFLLTAAPQCPDLDYYKNNAMYNILHPNPLYSEAYLDLVFVQFYNNYCSASKYSSTGNNNQWHSSNSFNFDEWNSWAEQNSDSTKIYLGILGKENRDDTGYVQFEHLTKILDGVHSYSRFGGVMIWDALYAYSNPVFNGDQYGHATLRYLTQLATPPLTVRVDDTTPLLLPIGPTVYTTPNNDYSDDQMNVTSTFADSTKMMTPFSCNQGQGFVLLSSMALRNLLVHFGVTSEQLNNLDSSSMNEDVNATLTKGSYLCFGPTSANGASYGLNFIYNATVAMIDDQRLRPLLSTLELSTG
ncbi:unnamed protein product [Absidia cylindrospora]